LIKGDASFKKLWLEYKSHTDPSLLLARQALLKRVHAQLGRNDHIRAHTALAVEASIDEGDEYKRWKVLDPLKPSHPLADDPI